MTPVEYYQKLVESDQILTDSQQEAVISRLQVIYDHLIALNKKSQLLKKFNHKNQLLTRGLYLWGEVGVGKTFLMDCFFYCLPFKNKLRTHFYKFMKMVHEQLKKLQGESKPLEKLAKKIASETSVICFDELIVNDITDAMLLAGLFKALYQENICLLFTSNIAPEQLYEKGIQRDNFLPVIDLISNHSEVFHITSHNDYRFRNYVENKFYYTPLNSLTEEKLERQFSELTQKAIWNNQDLHVYNRDIKVKKTTGGIIWFNFLDICGPPRSQNDYIVIANQFHTIFISDVLVIQPEQNDLARSFINLIDIFYDSHKKLIISAEKPIEQIYFCGRMLFDFSRIRSRIIEMQTLSWQEKCNHLQKNQE